MKKLVIRSIGIVAVLIASYYFLYPHVLRCQTIRFSEFKSIGNDIWVSPLVSPKEYNTIVILIELGAYRNALFWGEKKGEARFIICATLEEYERFGHTKEGAGSSISTPFSDSYIILTKEHLTIDVISHEMCHDEIYTRLGWQKATFGVPQWFHEGIALMLDYRFVATNDPLLRVIGYERELRKLRRRGYRKIDLKELASIKGFAQGGQLAINRAYMTAGKEVATWLALHPNALPTLIEAILAGKTFEEAYQVTEQSRHQNN